MFVVFALSQSAQTLALTVCLPFGISVERCGGVAGKDGSADGRSRV
jgi:hypothetical protein